MLLDVDARRSEPCLIVYRASSDCALAGAVRTILFGRLNAKYTEAGAMRFYRLALPDADSPSGVQQVFQARYDAFGNFSGA